MDIPNTADNRVLAAAVNSRIKADARIINAKAAGYRFLGIGALVALASFGVGAGAGAAFYGYSYLHGPPENLIPAVAAALKEVTLKGQVSIAPGATVRLDTGDATVKLDRSSTTLQPDPGFGSGGSNLETPSRKQSAREKPGTASQAPSVVTNYTIFKSVKFSKYSIMTGWDYASSNDRTPEHQYCYYVAPYGKGTEIKIDIAVDRTLVPNIKLKDGTNPTTAARSCIWFEGTETKPAQSQL